MTLKIPAMSKRTLLSDLTNYHKELTDMLDHWYKHDERIIKRNGEKSFRDDVISITHARHKCLSLLALHGVRVCPRCDDFISDDISKYRYTCDACFPSVAGGTGLF